MAHTFLKSEVINRTALQMLEREVVLQRLVWNYSGIGVAGAKNDSVDLRIPAILDAREHAFRNDRSATIQMDELTETVINVSLSKQPYSAVAVTDEQLRLDIVDFGEQVLAPQVRAVAVALEGYISTQMGAATYATTVDFAEGTDDPYKVALACRKALNDANVPAGERTLLVGSAVESAILSTDHLVRVDQSGSDSALREATVGRLAGFNVVQTNSLGENEAYAFHRTAYGFANVAPAVPAGAPFGSSQTYSGLAMRWIRDYDAPHLQDRSVVSAFAGTASIEDGERSDGAGGTEAVNVRAVKINFTAA